MVLFKRKPVHFLPWPKIEDDNIECWIIPETDEVFLSYESYLQRLDWYKAKRFICEITGHSGLSFFDALESETAGAKEVEVTFPEQLKEPILRKVQFSIISRIDNLVDFIYDIYKNDYYPGELVTVQVEDGQRLNGVIRDKARFPNIQDQSTGQTIRPAFTRYFVKLTDRPNQETLVDDSKVSRDRKIFTKQMLRSFIKNTVTREAWNGAPWLVKPSVAELYRIDTRVPPHLQYGHKAIEKKERKRAEQQAEGMFGVWQTSKLPELKPAPKGRKGQVLPQKPDEVQQHQFDEYPRPQMGDPAFATHGWDSLHRSGYPNGHLASHAHGQFDPPNGHFDHAHPHAGHKEITRVVPSPTIKYPIEDMDCSPLHNGIHRPSLKFMTESQSMGQDTDAGIIPGLQEHSVGLVLETWNTLNVYCQVLLLDSFTFDDFMEAMRFSSPEVECELFVEIHCAILKHLVNGENDQNGAIQISLPDLPEPEDSDDEQEEDESRLPTPTPEPDVPARRTRSSLNKMVLAEEVKAKSPTPETNPHRAAEMFNQDKDWIDRLRRRDFRNGGWQMIMVGLLHQVAGRPRLKEICDKILIHLAPLDAEPTMETARVQYSTMDINLRVQILQIICQLFLETKVVKTFLEETSNTMTQFRKIKIEHQRARKEAVARLKKLHDQRRLLAPQERSPTPLAELQDSLDADRTDEIDAEEIEDSEDEQKAASRLLRRGQDRAAERKRKRVEEQERREKAKEEKATKGTKEYRKVLKAIEKERKEIAEHEEQVEILDGDLREADAYRTRCLGKDRFCNRYWWFERNAMPYAGLPDSSTAHADYANGRLWVQGPDDMERLGYIDVVDEARNNYFRCFQMTPTERKLLEEGSTNLHHAHQWGFYDQPEDVDNLIEWLDPRGNRELKLKKELSSQRDMITKYMAYRKVYLETEKPSIDDLDSKPIVPSRMSTRTKTYVSEDLAQIHRCLKWKNTSALAELGHRHVEAPPMRFKKGKKAPEPRAAKKETTAPALNRQGKPVTRQGARYNF